MKIKTKYKPNDIVYLWDRSTDTIQEQRIASIDIAVASRWGNVVVVYLMNNGREIHESECFKSFKRICRYRREFKRSNKRCKQ